VLCSLLPLLLAGGMGEGVKTPLLLETGLINVLNEK